MDENSLKNERNEDMHKRKIDISDKIFVIYIGGYIGFKISAKIAYTKATGKGVIVSRIACDKDIGLKEVIDGV